LRCNAVEHAENGLHRGVPARSRLGMRTSC
jgi:hypothetical protein